MAETTTETVAETQAETERFGGKDILKIITADKYENGVYKTLKTITRGEFQRAVGKHLRAKGYVFDYVALSSQAGFQPELQPMPFGWHWIAVSVVTGNSEGYYVHIDFLDGKSRDFIGFIKVLDGQDAAFDIAAEVTRYLGA